MASNQGGGSAPRVSPPARSTSTSAPAAAAAPARPTAVQRFKVRATKEGYYGERRRRKGDVFIVANEQAFSSKWMERVSPATPLKETTVNEALMREHAGIMTGKSPQLQLNAADLVPEDETEGEGGGAGPARAPGDDVL